VRVRPTYICGGYERPGARGTDCPNELHDHPLPEGYVDASIVAGRRLNDGWSNKRCPSCGLHGWAPPTPEGTTDAVS
jgi:hypothetical protein